MWLVCLVFRRHLVERMTPLFTDARIKADALSHVQIFLSEHVQLKLPQYIPLTTDNLLLT